MNCKSWENIKQSLFSYTNGVIYKLSKGHFAFKFMSYGNADLKTVIITVLLIYDDEIIKSLETIQKIQFCFITF